MAGLVPAINVLASARRRRTSMPGTSPGVTWRVRGGRSRSPTVAPSLLRLAGVLDGLEGCEFDVVELAVDLLDLADVDVLHDVAGFRIDRDRAARAFPLHPLHGFDQRIAVGLATGLIEGLVDEMDAVIAADGHEAGTRAEGLLVGGDEILVHRG